MADISNVHASEIKEIFDNLESLSCKYICIFARAMLTSRSPHFDACAVLISLIWEKGKELAFGRLHSTGVRGGVLLRIPCLPSTQATYG